MPKFPEDNQYAVKALQEEIDVYRSQVQLLNESLNVVRVSPKNVLPCPSFMSGLLAVRPLVASWITRHNVSLQVQRDSAKENVAEARESMNAATNAFQAKQREVEPLQIGKDKHYELQRNVQAEFRDLEVRTEQELDAKVCTAFQHRCCVNFRTPPIRSFQMRPPPFNMMVHGKSP